MRRERVRRSSRPRAAAGHHALVGFGAGGACALIALMSPPASLPVPATPFPRVALVGRQVSPGIVEPLSRLASFLAARGHDVVIEAETARLT